MRRVSPQCDTLVWLSLSIVYSSFVRSHTLFIIWVSLVKIWSRSQSHRHNPISRVPWRWWGFSQRSSCFILWENSQGPRDIISVSSSPPTDLWTGNSWCFSGFTLLILSFFCWTVLHILVSHTSVRLLRFYWVVMYILDRAGWTTTKTLPVGWSCTFDEVRQEATFTDRGKRRTTRFQTHQSEGIVHSLLYPITTRWDASWNTRSRHHGTQWHKPQSLLPIHHCTQVTPCKGAQREARWNQRSVLSLSETRSMWTGIHLGTPRWTGETPKRCWRPPLRYVACVVALYVTRPQATVNRQVQKSIFDQHRTLTTLILPSITVILSRKDWAFDSYSKWLKIVTKGTQNGLSSQKYDSKAFESYSKGLKMASRHKRSL